ncbi:MAG: hypothetical protein H0U91_11570 [Rubrobacter sp.]|jgi:hypothetical protein|nr:hypothetical protein [Rubrobacter sp.]MBA3950874.1 hypothetical protein [Rubrobacter sp.]MDQ3362781.1 hypothetical protein [Actinomycetota bacterium]MDQ3377956.1 hypothetical protein [Actinomycetota bacterium]
MQTRDLTDEEILGLGNRVLLEKLGPAGYIRFIRLQRPPEGDYAEIREKIFEGMTVQDIYDEAVRLEAERARGRDAGR